jgi:hypothetical protein
VHPVLLIHAPDESRAVDYVTMGPSLPASDPLLQHIALVLQAVLAAEAEEGQLYVESLTSALVVHFLRRYAAARPSLRVGSGGLSPYKLRRTIAYIQAHLAQELSLLTLATVAQTSPTHFARLVQARHRADAPPVRDPVPHRARPAVTGRDRPAPQRDRFPDRVRGPKLLHRAFSNAHRPDPPSLPKPYQAGVSGGGPLTAERGTRGVRLPPHWDDCRKISTCMVGISQTARHACGTIREA